MATPTTPWAKGFSENPDGQPIVARTIIEMLDLVGDELVALPVPAAPGVTGDGEGSASPRMTRRELLARVLWTRAILDADGAATKLIIEYLDGKPGDAEAVPGTAPTFNADDMALAEAMLKAEGLKVES